jgi:UDP-N-acetylmuramate dehydrogenase
VYAVRAQRGMVWRKGQAGPGTVGSFFTNPVVPEAQARALLQTHPTMPIWPGPGGHKLSAAWLIEAAGLPKGWRCEEAGLRVGTSPLHALALVTLAGANADDVCCAATVISKRVLDRLGVALRAEAQRVGFAAPEAPFG